MATYPNQAWPGDAAVELLDGTSDARTGLPYIAKGTGPSSVPSLEVQYNRREQRINQILAGWREGMVVDEGGLKIGVYPIHYTRGGARRAFPGTSGVSVAGDAVRVIYLDNNDELAVADDWPVDITSYLPLALIDTTGEQMTIEDRRTLTAFHVASVESSGVRDRRVVTAYCASLGASQSDVQIFAYDPPEDLTLVEVQVFCTGTAATASVNVKEAGTSVLSAAATPVAGGIVKPAISDADISAANHVTIHVTTDGTGNVTNLTITLLFKAPLSM